MATLLKAKDVGKRYGISYSSLRRWEAQGAIVPSRTPGGQRRYDPDQIEAMMRGGAPPVSKASPPPPSPREAYAELGVSGLRKWGGAIYEERLRELQGRQGLLTYREMRLNDPVIHAVFLAIENSMRQAAWRVAPASEDGPDIEAADFLETALHDMSFDFSTTMTFVLQMLESGFSLLELVYKRRLGDEPRRYLGISEPARSRYNDGRVSWRKWAPRPALSLSAAEPWLFDEHGGIRGIRQQPEGMGKPVIIPIEKLLLFRTTAAPSNNPEGMPIHRAMYLSYWYSNQIQEIEGIGVERDLAGIPVIYLGTDCSLTGTNSDYELAKTLVTNIRQDEQMGVVLPKPKLGTAEPGQGMLLELLGGAGGNQFDTGTILERYDKRKALAVLAQFIMLGLDKVGSYALSQQHGDLFATTVRAWLDDIASIINSYAVPRLFELNSFPRISGLPQVKPGDIGSVNLPDVAEYVNRLVQAQVLTPDTEMERYLRALGGLPEPQPAEIGEGVSPEAAQTGRRVAQRLEGMSQAEVAEIAKRGGADEYADRLKRKLDLLWATLVAKIRRGEDIGKAIRQWRLDVEIALEEAYRTAAQESAKQSDHKELLALFLLLVQPRLARAKDALQRFADQLRHELELARLGVGDGHDGAAIDAMVDVLGRRRSRALMYAGGVVTIVAAAAMYGRFRKRYIWLAVNDQGTCPDCAEESLKGPRMMHEFTRLPGENVQCLTNCRCELAEV